MRPTLRWAARAAWVLPGAEMLRSRCMGAGPRLMSYLHTAVGSAWLQPTLRWAARVARLLLDAVARVACLALALCCRWGHAAGCRLPLPGRSAAPCAALVRSPAGAPPGAGALPFPCLGLIPGCAASACGPPTGAPHLSTVTTSAHGVAPLRVQVPGRGHHHGRGHLPAGGERV